MLVKLLSGYLGEFNCGIGLWGPRKQKTENKQTDYVRLIPQSIMPDAGTCFPREIRGSFERIWRASFPPVWPTYRRLLTMPYLKSIAVGRIPRETEKSSNFPKNSGRTRSRTGWGSGCQWDRRSID